MKYKVKTEIVTPGEYDVEVALPLGVKDDDLTDQMVRAQAKEAPEAICHLKTGEKIVEVWRGETRIFPRAKGVRRKKAEKVEDVKNDSADWMPPGKPVFPDELAEKLEKDA